VRLTPRRWAALVVTVNGDLERDVEALVNQLESLAAAQQARLAASWLPRLHPERAVDALAVLRACTYWPSGAVVASPTTSLPEAPGYQRQFDYRYTWLRDASVSTAVAALLGQPEDARRHLDLVYRAWGGRDMTNTPVLDVRGEQLPEPRAVPGVSGWAASRPVRIGNAAHHQRQYDALGLFVEAISVYVQVGGRLDAATWQLVTRLADGVAGDEPDRVKNSNGIWEFERLDRWSTATSAAGWYSTAPCGSHAAGGPGPADGGGKPPGTLSAAGSWRRWTIRACCRRPTATATPRRTPRR
jgi:GH15 family glucan-1,4-alpha-glucosidase